MISQRVLEGLSAVSALLFAVSLYCPNVCISLSWLSNRLVNNSMPKRIISSNYNLRKLCEVN